MKNLVKALAVAAAMIPALAFAQIANTRHDLSNVSTAATRSAAAGGTDQTCIFCHTPHRGATQQLLWNRAASANATFGWGGTTATTGTTPLPTALRPQSMACLSCHDGSVGLGDVRNAAGAAASFTMIGNANAAGQLTGGYVVGAGGNMSGNHPISIAYPRAGGSNYYGNISGIGAAGVGDFRVVANTGCNTPTGLCTTHAAGAAITIYTDAVNGGYGIECGSCHDVHNRAGVASGNGFFLRATTAQSAICLACHAK